MSNLVIYIRHGENHSNVEHEFSYKVVDRPLTDKGVLQAIQTAKFLKNNFKMIEGIYSSPMVRTKQTADIIAEELGQSIVEVEEFREIDVGELDGRNFKDEPELVDIYLDIVRQWNQGAGEIQFPQGEDQHNLANRFKQGLIKILDGKQNSTIIIVAHGGIFQHSLDHLFELDGKETLEETGLKNCSISKLQLKVNGDTLMGEILELNYTQHLSGRAADFYKLE